MAWAALAPDPRLRERRPMDDHNFDGMAGNVLSAAQWAHAGTSIALWTVRPLLLGAWRITRRRSRRDRSPAPRPASPLDVARQTQERRSHEATDGMGQCDVRRPLRGGRPARQRNH